MANDHILHTPQSFWFTYEWGFFSQNLTLEILTLKLLSKNKTVTIVNGALIESVIFTVKRMITSYKTQFWQVKRGLSKLSITWPVGR